MNTTNSSNIVTASTSAPAPPVTICRGSWAATVRNGPRDVISRILAVPLRRFDVASDGRLLTTQERVVFFKQAAQGKIITLSGLVPRLAKGLAAAGYQVVIKDRRAPDPLKDADFSFRQLPASEGWIKQLCEAVVREPRGQLILDNEKEIARAVAEVLRLFPERSVCIVANSNARIRSVHRQLRDLTARKVTIDPRRFWETKPRTLICLAGLASSCRPEDFAIMLYTDVESVVASPTTRCRMQRGSGTRIYAFFARARRLDAYQQLTLEAATGPVIFDQTQAAGCLPEVHVWHAGPPAYPAQRDTRDPLLRKRANIWHNLARNGLVAELAGSISDMDPARLRELNLNELGDALAQLPQTSPPCVAVVVESVELKKLLPWPLRHEMPVQSVSGGQRLVQFASH
jgi:hypothetical protein